MLDAAALLILVSQPSCCRNGMYSPNGTSRVLMYWPRMPAGPTSTPTFSWPRPGTLVSWLTSRSSPSWLARASTIATLTMTSAKLISHTPPTAASASTAGCCHWLTPNTAHGPPSACQDRSHSPSSQQLGTTTRAASARGQVTGGLSSFQAATPNGIHSAPTTAPTSSTAGPISGVIQYSAAIRYPAPSHQARIPPSRAVGDLTISTSPGTSPNQARNSRFGAGNARMSSAPRSSISRLGDQIHRPVLLSALLTLPLSADPAGARDCGPSSGSGGALG